MKTREEQQAMVDRLMDAINWLCGAKGDFKEPEKFTIIQ